MSHGVIFIRRLASTTLGVVELIGRTPQHRFDEVYRVGVVVDDQEPDPVE